MVYAIKCFREISGKSTCRRPMSKNLRLFSIIAIKVTCRVQIWKKRTFCQNSDYFVYCFIKNDTIFMYLLCIYKKTIILILFKTDTLKFTVYIVTILTCPLKTYVVRLHNLTLMNIFFTIDLKRSQVFFIIIKRKPKSNFNKHFLHNTINKVTLRVS